MIAECLLIHWVVLGYFLFLPVSALGSFHFFTSSLRALFSWSGHNHFSLRVPLAQRNKRTTIGWWVNRIFYKDRGTMSPCNESHCVEQVHTTIGLSVNMIHSTIALSVNMIHSTIALSVNMIQLVLWNNVTLSACNVMWCCELISTIHSWTKYWLISQYNSTGFVRWWSCVNLYYYIILWINLDNTNFTKILTDQSITKLVLSVDGIV